MRIRFTTTLQPPFAVQDVEGKVVGFEPDRSDPSTQDRIRCSSDSAAEHHCGAMPQCIYVKVDDCQLSLLPEDFAASAVQRGVFAVKPISRTWKYALPDAKGNFVKVRRKQFPIMPARVVPLYSMQGTTADPGLVAYWCFPDLCSDTVRWLIVYVMLSRPRSLDTLRSVGLGLQEEKIRKLIEGLNGRTPRQAFNVPRLAFFWSRSGLDPESIWGRFGVDSGSIWGRFGFDLGSIQARSQVDPGSIWGRSRSNTTLNCTGKRS
jgi:hypothetical protein